MLHRFASLCVLVLLCSVTVTSQTLAHPGWRGNGIASQAWWKHTSFVRFSADTTFAEAARSLDAMSEAGVDSMILPDLQPVADAALPFNARFGTEDDLDTLLREVSARRMHVLLVMPVERLSAGGGEVRFWMSRGIAGFDVSTFSPGDLAVLRGVRSAMTRFPGERILMAHTAANAVYPVDTRRDPITLHTGVTGEASSTKPGPESWKAVEVTAWDSPPSSLPGGIALVFDANLLKQQGGAAKAHAMLTERASVARHSHPK